MHVLQCQCANQAALQLAGLECMTCASQKGCKRVASMITTRSMGSCLAICGTFGAHQANCCKTCERPACLKYIWSAWNPSRVQEADECGI